MEVVGLAVLLPYMGEYMEVRDEEDAEEGFEDWTAVLDWIC
jgi:hypothetical protein